MRILGIDPGIALMGFGIVESDKRGLKAGTYGHISTESGTPVPQRLKILYDDLMMIIEQTQPDIVAVEELFFNKNVKTAMVASQARGVILLAAMNSGLDVAEYTPLQVKQAVIGYGRATKEQVQIMVTKLLGLSEIPRPDDTADALAIAICHANSAAMERLKR